MKYSPFFPVLFFLCLMLSCEKEESSPLFADAEKWTSYGFSNYDFTLQISCFCIVDYTQPKRILVRDNKVISVAGVPFEELNDSSFRTIDGFFLYIEEQRKLNPVVEEIQYDDEYGFPSYIYFDISERIADEEIGYTLTDFVPY